MGRGGEFSGVLSGRRRFQRRPPVPRRLNISYLLSETPDWRRTCWGSEPYLRLMITNLDVLPPPRPGATSFMQVTSLMSHFANEGLRQEEVGHFAQRHRDGKWLSWSSSSGRGLHTPLLESGEQMCERNFLSTGPHSPSSLSTVAEAWPSSCSSHLVGCFSR